MIQSSLEVSEMATKAKKNTKIEIEKNEEVLDEPIPLMALDEEGEAKIDELPGVVLRPQKNCEKLDLTTSYHWL